MGAAANTGTGSLGGSLRPRTGMGGLPQFGMGGQAPQAGGFGGGQIAGGFGGPAPGQLSGGGTPQWGMGGMSQMGSGWRGDQGGFGGGQLAGGFGGNNLVFGGSGSQGFQQGLMPHQLMPQGGMMSQQSPIASTFGHPLGIPTNPNTSRNAGGTFGMFY